MPRHIGLKVSLHIGGKVSRHIGGKVSQHIGGKVSQHIGGKVSRHIGGKVSRYIGGKVSRHIGGKVPRHIGEKVGILLLCIQLFYHTETCLYVTVTVTICCVDSWNFPARRNPSGNGGAVSWSHRGCTSCRTC